MAFLTERTLSSERRPVINAGRFLLFARMEKLRSLLRFIAFDSSSAIELYMGLAFWGTKAGFFRTGGNPVGLAMFLRCSLADSTALRQSDRLS